MKKITKLHIEKRYFMKTGNFKGYSNKPIFCCKKINNKLLTKMEGGHFLQYIPENSQQPQPCCNFQIIPTFHLNTHTYLPGEPSSSASFIIGSPSSSSYPLTPNSSWDDVRSTINNYTHDFDLYCQVRSFLKC